jgi:hypothetical protein
MYLVKDLDQIHLFLLSNFCLYFGMEGVYNIVLRGVIVDFAWLVDQINIFFTIDLMRIEFKTLCILFKFLNIKPNLVVWFWFYWLFGRHCTCLHSDFFLSDFFLKQITYLVRAFTCWKITKSMETNKRWSHPSKAMSDLIGLSPKLSTRVHCICG